MKYLFASFAAGEIARRVGLTYADIGSRGGFQSDLHPLAFAVDVVGFEPDPIEFDRLQSQPAAPWKSVTFLPHGVSGHSGPRTLHIPVDPQSVSILEHDPRFGEKFNKPQFF